MIVLQFKTNHCLTAMYNYVGPLKSSCGTSDILSCDFRESVKPLYILDDLFNHTVLIQRIIRLFQTAAEEKSDGLIKSSGQSAFILLDDFIAIVTRFAID